MDRFLSEENIALHREYIRTKRLKYSIIEDSVPALKGAELGDIYRMKITEIDRRDSLSLLSEITLHDVFFSSFAQSQYPRSHFIERMYGSEAVFLNLLYKYALGLRYGFILVYVIGGRVRIAESTDFASDLRSGVPLLAIDVCEHSYFMDYGFDKERYLLSLLPYLDISKLSARNERDRKQ